MGPTFNRVSAVNLLSVALGSAIGGVCRWLLGNALQRRLGPALAPMGAQLFPVGTMIVNVSGSFLIGALAILATRQTTGSEATLLLLLIVGFCGGYTTFSTFSLDTVLLVQQGATGLAALNVAASLTLSVGATFGGMILMRTVLGRA